MSVPGGAGRGLSPPPPGTAGSFLLSSVAEGLVDGRIAEGLVDAAELRSVDVETQARLEALLEAAGIGKISTTDGKVSWRVREKERKREREGETDRGRERRT